MLTLLLTTCLGIALQNEPVLLKHATKHTFTIAPDDPVLEDVGPSKTFRYVLESEDAVLFVWAESPDADLVLQAHLESSAGETSRSGPTALLSGQKPQKRFEDDDSGGGTTPFLRLGRMSRGTISIQVAAKRRNTEIPLTVHCFEARESDATRSVAASLGKAIEESQGLAQSGDLEGARATLADALKAVFEITAGDLSEALSETLWRLGGASHRLNDFETARNAWSRVYAYRLRSLPNDHAHLQRARGNLAAMNASLGDLDRASALQEQILEVYSRTLPDDHPDLQIARGNLALTIRAQGDLDRAHELQEQLLEVYSRTLPKDHPLLQRARLNFATTIKQVGDLNGARTLQEEVLEAYTRTLPKDHAHLQVARGNLAMTAYALGDLDVARALQEQALEAYSRTLPKDHPHLLVARLNLAATLYSLDDLDRARALQEQVLEVRARTLPEDHPLLQTARSNLAGTIYSLGDPQRARTLQEQVLDVYSRTLSEDHFSLQWARVKLALTIRALGDLDSARALQEQALEVLSRTLPEDHSDLQAAREDAARTYAEIGNAGESQRLAREVAAATIRAGRRLDSLTMQQLASEWVICSVLSIVSGAGVFESDAVGEQLAFSMCEAIRGAEATAARLERSLGADAEAQRLRKELARASRELNSLSGTTSDQHSTIVDLVRERDRLRRTLLKRLEETGADQSLPDLDARSIRARLAPTESAIAYWRYHRWEIGAETPSQSEHASYLAWVLRPGAALARIELGSAHAIEQAIDDWRKALGAPTRGITQEETLGTRQVDAGEAVRSLILDPVLKHLGDARRVWVAPSDAMHLVPFDALPDVEGVLGDRYEFALLQSLSDLTIDSPAELNPLSLFAMGGVHYDGKAKAWEGGKGDDSKGAGRSALAGKGSKGYEWSFPILSSTGGEARDIAEYFLMAFEEKGAPEPTVLMRRQASRDAFEALAPKHRFLHLATHGWFAPESVSSKNDDRVIDERMGFLSSSLRDQVIGLAPSLLCGLAFAGANGEADMFGRVRGVMTAEEIRAMDLTSVELCLLSACETNVGIRRGGQGIASLQTALHAAGARTAITSLWKVPDEATRKLMTEFYRRLWVLGEPKGRALWNAKQKLRQELIGKEEPVYSVRDWAGWVLSGDPD